MWTFIFLFACFIIQLWCCKINKLRMYKGKNAVVAEIFTDIAAQ